MAHVDFGAECSAASGQVRFSAFSEPVKFHLGGGGGRGHGTLSSLEP